MSDQEPVSPDLRRRVRHDERDYERSARVYAELVRSPVRTLQDNDLMVNALPNAGEGAEIDLWFAARSSIIVAGSQQEAAGLAGVGLGGAICTKMVVSPMRGSGLASGSGAGERLEGTGIVDAGSLEAELWVTEQQTGCSVLILDWGRGRYSMVHLQPHEDTQFSRFSRAVMGLGGYTWGLTSESFFRSAYKNASLKQEASSVVANTGRTPESYILVQTMFDASRAREAQLIGVRSGSRFRFYRHRVMGRTGTQVDELRWSGWWSWLPAFTSRAY